MQPFEAALQQQQAGVEGHSIARTAEHPAREARQPACPDVVDRQIGRNAQRCQVFGHQWLSRCETGVETFQLACTCPSHAAICTIFPKEINFDRLKLSQSSYDITQIIYLLFAVEDATRTLALWLAARPPAPDRMSLNTIRSLRKTPWSSMKAPAKFHSSLILGYLSRHAHSQTLPPLALVGPVGIRRHHHHIPRHLANPAAWLEKSADRAG